MATLDRDPDYTVFEARTPEDTARVVREAARDGFDVVVAAGGDGTVHTVANALMSVGGSADERPALGILPFGTGNDLARTLAIPFAPEEALALLASAPRRRLDVIAIRAPGGAVSYAINVVSGGFAVDMRKRMDDDMKKRWGPFAYLIAAAETLPRAATYLLRYRCDGGDEQTIAAHSLVVASGRMAGGGGMVAPMANPEDGWIDVVIVREATVAARAALAARAAVGDYVQSDLVETWRVRRLDITSDPEMAFAVDGEVKAKTPVTFEAVPHALRVIVGQEYAPDPDYSGKAD